jgi:hypothetical protein
MPPCQTIAPLPPVWGSDKTARSAPQLRTDRIKGKHLFFRGSKGKRPPTKA